MVVKVALGVFIGLVLFSLVTGWSQSPYWRCVAGAPRGLRWVEVQPGVSVCLDTSPTPVVKPAGAVHPPSVGSVGLVLSGMSFAPLSRS